MKSLRILSLIILTTVFSFAYIESSCVIKDPSSFFYEDRLDYIQMMLPEYDKETLDGLIVDRQGDTENSNMTTLGLQTAVRKNKAYLVTLEGLVEVEDKSNCLEMRPIKGAPAPDFVEINAKWDKNPFMDGDKNNILGKNGRFILEADSIEVPVVEATDETLSYYGARTVSPGDVVEFPTAVFPLWVMNLGKNYVQDFIMSDKGGGMYLEYHNDKPHFHMPLTCDAGGYLLLAKKVDEDKYHLTGFKIPYGKGVYTYKGSLHNDAALTGTAWLVGYSDAIDFSTVLIRQKDSNDKVKVNFID